VIPKLVLVGAFAAVTAAQPIAARAVPTGGAAHPAPAMPAYHPLPSDYNVAPAPVYPRTAPHAAIAPVHPVTLIWPSRFVLWQPAPNLLFQPNPYCSSAWGQWGMLATSNLWPGSGLIGQPNQIYSSYVLGQNSPWLPGY
jgi:hypothetical protein